MLWQRLPSTCGTYSLARKPPQVPPIPQSSGRPATAAQKSVRQACWGNGTQKWVANTMIGGYQRNFAEAPQQNSKYHSPRGRSKMSAGSSPQASVGHNPDLVHHLVSHSSLPAASGKPISKAAVPKCTLVYSLHNDLCTVNESD